MQGPVQAPEFAFWASDTLNSAHCSVATLCHSDTALKNGIDNQPDEQVRDNLLRLSETLTAVSRLSGSPLQITSGFRCESLNRAVGGVEGSQHSTGQAADFKCPSFGSALELAHAIAASSITFDQLILEYGRWVHLSVAAAGETPRREVLHINSAAEGYLDGLPPRTEAGQNPRQVT